ncbi:hypothetical protein QQF64_019515 [Cirrhinus molitorella]|uniref:Uncharacterized protein n=1 Tax=Cirrhinus molitorella TaxID=172907 RepID=A0ABR3LFP1_9TELE
MTRRLEISKQCHTCLVPPDSVSLIVLISGAAAGSLLIVAAVGIFCICRKFWTKGNERTNSALSKSASQKKKSMDEHMYENFASKG